MAVCALPSVISLDPASSSTGPVVKWAGGKSSIVDRLVSMAPRAFSRYFEPFFGGGALFFRLSPAVATVGDLNTDLILMYQEIVRDADSVHAEASRIFDLHRSDPCSTYLRFRDLMNETGDGDGSLSATERAATFLYLNRVCFNGLYRVNKSNEFNVPLGDKAGRRRCRSLDFFVRAAQALSRATIVCSGYDRLVESASRGDFVYFDPPYLSSSLDFVSYTSGGFGVADHDALTECARRLVTRGVCVMISNLDTRYARRSYARAGFRVRSLKAPRSISARGDVRTAASEIVAMGGYP
jgi:DNA adenine methylase